MKRHERKGPESASNTQPGRNASLVKVRARIDYSEAGEIATAAVPEANADLPDFETGWMHHVEDGEPAGYVAFLRPWHENWYDLHYCDNWVDAISRALALTKSRPNCLYIGGPEQ